MKYSGRIVEAFDVFFSMLFLQLDYDESIVSDARYLLAYFVMTYLVSELATFQM